MSSAVLEVLTHGEVTLTATAGRDTDAFNKLALMVEPDHLLAYWPATETSGTTLVDRTANDRDGLYVGPTLDATDFDDGLPAPEFDGADNYANLWSAGLAAALDGTVGTVFLRANPDDLSGVQTLFEWYADYNHWFWFRVSSGVLTCTRCASGTESSVSVTLDSTDEFSLAVTWDEDTDAFCVYLNAIQVGGTQVGLGVWDVVDSGVPLTMTEPLDAWDGAIGRVGLWDIALSSAAIVVIGV